MSTQLRGLIDRDLQAVEGKDLDGVLACFAPDGVLIDPHYPYPEARGHDEIRYNLEWAFTGMESMGFTVTGYFESADSRSAAVETQSHHIQRGGRHLDFAQVFIVDTENALITRMQSFLPYGPNGVGGFFLRAGNRSYRRKHRRA